jgi:hypothetical protein
MYARFAYRFHSGAPSCEFLRARRGQVRIVWMLEQFPPKPFSCLRCQVCRARARIIVLKNRRALVTRRALQLVGRLNTTNYVDGSLPQQEPTNMYRSAPQITYHNFSNRGYDFGFLLLWRSSVLKFHAISFRVGGINFHHESRCSVGRHRHRHRRSVVEAKCTSMRVFFCAFPSAVGEANDNKLSGVPKYLYFSLHEVMSNAKLRCDSPNRQPSVLCDERINLLHSLVDRCEADRRCTRVSQ